MRNVLLKNGVTWLLAGVLGAALMSSRMAGAQTVFEETSALPVRGDARDLVEGDFNGDGKPDLFVLSQESGTDRFGNPIEGTLTLFANEGGRKLTPSLTIAGVLAGTDPSALAAGDFNNDGKLDLVVTERNSNSFTLLVGFGDGYFNDFKYFATGPSPSSVVAGDFNQDGFADVALTDYGSFLPEGAGGNASRNSEGDYLEIRYGNGKGEFPASAFYDLSPNPANTSTNPRKLIATELNGDGVTDFVTANGYSIGKPFYTATGSLGILASLAPQPDSRYAVGDLPAGSNLNSVTAGDFNGDGRTDLAVLAIRYESFEPVGTIKVWISTPDHGLIPQPEIPDVYDTYLNYTDEIRAADMNRDGKADLVVTGRFGLQVFRSHGDGTFEEPQVTSLGSAGKGLILDDLDGDGHPDAAMTLQYGLSGSAAGQSLAVAWGEADRATLFAPPLWIRSPTHSRGIVPSRPSTVDFNHDGLSDLATVETAQEGNGVVGGTYVQTYLGDKTGGLKPGPSMGPFRGGDNLPGFVEPGEFNGDGNPDLFQGGRTGTGGNVTFLPGKGDGAFGTAGRINVTNLSLGRFTGDFDGDGKTDLVVANFEASTFYLYASSTGYQAASRPLPGTFSSMHIADFNGDGKADIVFHAPQSGTLWVYPGNAQALLGDPITQGTDKDLETADVTLDGDLNGDGKPDLLGLIDRGTEKKVYGILPGNGDGTFGHRIETTLEQGLYDGGPISADFNLDGLPDLIIPHEYDVRVALGTGQGQFREDPGKYFMVGWMLTVGDYNGDGKPDLASTYVNGISVRLNAAISPKEKGDLDSDGKVTVADAILSLKWVVGLGHSLSLEEVAVSDLDGDRAVTVKDTLLILRAAVGLRNR